MSWGKEIECEACQAFYLFRNEFNKLNDTVTQMLDSNYHMTLKLFCNHISGMKTLGFCHTCDVKSVIS